MATLSRAEYRRKTYGCWLGKNIGGTLGAPQEGRTQVLNLTYYDPVPTSAIANDDLDLQLIWLAALRAHGPATDERVLGDWWRQSQQYPFDEYGIAKLNLHRGIDPPVSGLFANHFTHCMGAPIRSEIWACVAPGCPGVAAEYAYCDGCVDHGGEGLYGEMLFAALQSAAFVISDVDQLLDLGLEMIPADCRTAGAVRLTRQCHREGLDWLAARERILQAYGDVNFTDAPQNIAFTILGWLWGTDASDAMCKAVNCGYDTDCTGATLGAILGLIHGPEIFEQRWIDPIGEDVVVGWGVTGCETPRNLQELTAWTEALADQVLAAHQAPLRLAEATDLAGLTVAATQPASLRDRLAHHGFSLRVATEPTAWIGLGGPPALAPGEARVISVEAADRPVEVTAPAGWTVTAQAPGAGAQRFELVAGPDVAEAPAHHVTVHLGELAAPVTFVPACGWRVAGPVAVDDPSAALDAPPATGAWRTVWTPDHRLQLDDGGDRARVWRIRCDLTIGEAKDARLIAATPELQRVWLDGAEVITKREPTRFIPAPHRSGPGTVAGPSAWAAGAHPVEILLVARPGQPALVHLYLTRSNKIEGPRMVPWSDVVHRLPAD